MNTVLKDFVCKETMKLHKAGSTYVGDRLEELQELGYVGDNDSDTSNKNEWPKHTGGGHYELSNGDKVKGKDAAVAAQAEIDEFSN
jgi:hypothetical protein